MKKSKTTESIFLFDNVKLSIVSATGNQTGKKLKDTRRVTLFTGYEKQRSKNAPHSHDKKREKKKVYKLLINGGNWSIDFDEITQIDVFDSENADEEDPPSFTITSADKILSCTVLSPSYRYTEDALEDPHTPSHVADKVSKFDKWVENFSNVRAEYREAKEHERKVLEVDSFRAKMRKRWEEASRSDRMGMESKARKQIIGSVSGDADPSDVFEVRKR